MKDLINNIRIIIFEQEEVRKGSEGSCLEKKASQKAKSSAWVVGGNHFGKLDKDAVGRAPMKATNVAEAIVDKNNISNYT